MYIEGIIIPNWNIEEIKMLQYKLDYHKDLDLIKAYAESGHNKESMLLYNCFEDSIDVNFDYIRQSFSYLKNLSLAVNLFTPGQYLPLHSDLFQRYKEVHGLSTDQPIIRIILMLEDSVPGQIIQINDRTISSWKSGQWVGWVNDDKHAFYNFSKVNRYAVQITATFD